LVQSKLFKGPKFNLTEQKNNLHLSMIKGTQCFLRIYRFIGAETFD